MLGKPLKLFTPLELERAICGCQIYDFHQVRSSAARWRILRLRVHLKSVLCVDVWFFVVGTYHAVRGWI